MKKTTGAAAVVAGLGIVGTAAFATPVAAQADAPANGETPSAKQSGVAKTGAGKHAGTHDLDNEKPTGHKPTRKAVNTHDRHDRDHHNTVNLDQRKNHSRVGNDAAAQVTRNLAGAAVNVSENVKDVRLVNGPVKLVDGPVTVSPNFQDVQAGAYQVKDAKAAAPVTVPLLGKAVGAPVEQEDTDEVVQGSPVTDDTPAFSRTFSAPKTSEVPEGAADPVGGILEDATGALGGVALPIGG